MTQTVLLAALGGGFVGLFVAACCVAAGREDEAMERNIKEVATDGT